MRLRYGLFFVTGYTSVSPVRIRIAFSTGMTKIFPSPIFHVRVNSVMIVITGSTSFSLTTISI